MISAFRKIFALLISIYRFGSSYIASLTGRSYSKNPLPPGPCGLPLLGYAPFLGKDPWITLTKLYPKYGSVMSLYLGTSYCVVLHDYDAIKAAFVDQDELFQGRPDNSFVSKYISTGNNGKVSGLIAVEGRKWQDTSGFLVEHWRKLDRQPTSFADIITEEVNNFLLEKISIHATQPDVPYDPANDLYFTYSNIILRILTGRKFNYDMLEFEEVMGQFHFLFAGLGEGTLQSYPWLRFLPGHFRNQWKGIAYSRQKQRELFALELERHRKLQPEIPDYKTLTHYYFKQLDEGSTGIAFRDDDDFITTSAILLCAGPEGPTIPITWGLLLMCYHPSVQKKVQDEIDAVVGRSKRININDKDSLPYTAATCHEMSRLGGNSPLGVPRSNYEETTILNFKIPKRTTVFMNSWCALRDPKYFEDPLVFRPERFIQHGKLLLPPQYQVLFSMGKRVCPGQDIAEKMTFITFANILQKFTVQGAAGYPLPSLDEFAPRGVSARPLPYKVKISLRS